MSFAGTAGLGLIAITALWLALPKGFPGQRPEVRRKLRVMTRPPVLIAMLTTVLRASAMFTLYTHVAPMLETQTGASGRFVTLSLVLFGLGFTLGNWRGGRSRTGHLMGQRRSFWQFCPLQCWECRW